HSLLAGSHPRSRRQIKSEPGATDRGRLPQLLLSFRYQPAVSRWLLWQPDALPVPHSFNAQSRPVATPSRATRCAPDGDRDRAWAGVSAIQCASRHGPYGTPISGAQAPEPRGPVATRSARATVGTWGFQ